MREKLQRFMYGRYGVDRLSKAMIWAAFACCIVSMLLVGKLGTISSLLYYGGLVLMIYSYVRVFSRNIQKRYAQNQAYERWLAKLKKIPYNLKQLKTHHIYKCTSCGQKIRIPRGKGRIEITCPRCKNRFIKNS